MIDTGVFGEDAHWRGRHPAVWVMVLMLGIGALLCTIGAVNPPHPDSPAALNGVLATLGAALAVTMWLRPPARWHLHLAGAIYVTANTALISAAATGEGALSSGVSFVWLSMYAAVFFPLRVARVYAAASAGALAVALALNPVITSGFAAWIVVAVTLVAAVEVLAQLLNRMRGMALTDRLTGALNRAALEAMIAYQQRNAARTGTRLSLALIDLDDFKQVNDRDGHVEGDRLLVALTAEWRANLRARDLLFRYGGDEFVLLLPDTRPDTAAAVLSALQVGSVGCWSYGVGEIEPGDDLHSALARADAAMYAHKTRARPAPAGADGITGQPRLRTAV